MEVVVSDDTLPFESTMVVSYRLSGVTIALSLTIRLQFAIKYLHCRLCGAQTNRGVAQWVKGLKCDLVKTWTKEIMSISSAVKHNART